MSYDGWPDLSILLASMHDFNELGAIIAGKNRPTQPDGEALERVRDHVDVHRLWLVSAELLALAQALVHDALPCKGEACSVVLL